MKFLLLAALAVLAAAPAVAQTQNMQPLYGGQVVVLGHNHVEMIVHDGALRAWVRDHSDAPVAATGKAVVLAGGARSDVTLKADGAALVAELPVKQADKVTAVLSLTIDGAVVSARFAQDAVIVPALAGPAQAGAAAFAQSCASCHGTALRGTRNGPPLLHANYAPGGMHGDDMILAAMRNGAKAHHWKFGDMPKPDGLVPGQEAGLLAYIRAMQSANNIAAAPAAGHMHH